MRIVLQRINALIGIKVDDLLDVSDVRQVARKVDRVCAGFWMNITRQSRDISLDSGDTDCPYRWKQNTYVFAGKQLDLERAHVS